MEKQQTRSPLEAMADAILNPKPWFEEWIRPNPADAQGAPVVARGADGEFSE